MPQARRPNARAGTTHIPRVSARRVSAASEASCCILACHTPTRPHRPAPRWSSQQTQRVLKAAAAAAPSYMQKTKVKGERARRRGGGCSQPWPGRRSACAAAARAPRPAVSPVPRRCGPAPPPAASAAPPPHVAPARRRTQWRRRKPPPPTRVRGVSIFLDKNRRHIGKSQSKRPPKRTDATDAAPPPPPSPPGGARSGAGHSCACVQIAARGW
jgi:hypothetical protein